CNALLAARDELRGTAMLNWDTALAMPEWEGVTLGTLGVEKVALPFFELDGTIPAELGELDNLKVLHLARNGLTGEIPPELGSLARLETLLLWDNALVGEVPAELGDLARLEELMLSSNELTGELPAELGKLLRLKKLYVYANELTGEIPPELGGMGSIEYLMLHYNGFSGAIPPELGNARSLRWLDLEHNRLTGAIPPDLGRLRSLEYLDLEDNQLTDSIPPELADASELKWVYLGHNQLVGSIPKELGSLEHLIALRLYTNRFEGTIPPELAGRGDSRLSSLYLHNNPHLTGPIPMSFIENELSRFWWSGTGLCSPNVPWFQAWLQSIEDHRGGDVCADGDFEAFSGLGIGNDGSITLQAAGITLSVGHTGCLHSSTLNGKLWDYHWSEWQRDTGSGWNDVSDTRTEGRLCGLDLTSAPDGKYRLVGDWTLAGVRGKYKSGNEVTVGSGSAIFGRVLIEDEGLDGVTVGLSNGASATTSGGGNYRFDSVGVGTYTVTISGYSDDFSFDDTSKTVTISAGQSAEVNFHGIYLHTSSIAGRVFVDGLGLGGVTVTLSGTDSRSISTGDDGQYIFTGLGAGSYRVTISGYDADAYEFEVTSQDVTLALDQTVIVNFEGRVRADDYRVLSGLTITNSGAIRWGNLTNTGCLGATRITIGGSTYDVHWTEWQRKTSSSSWTQVSGTRKTGEICGYNLNNAAAGTYRFAGEFTPAGGTRAKYKSENEVTAGGGARITSNGGGERATITMPENHTSVTTVTASGGTPPYEFQWSTNQNAPDGRLFVMNTVTGDLAFRTAPDYENPTDSDGDNNYVVHVYVVDASLPRRVSDSQIITVTITDEDEDNQSPVTVGSIPSATMNAGESVSVNASSYFSDP
ncbi:MAG: carboxypeptidase regulatory-like domain-containing protein, partial [Gemmatimonadota bacterium]|nr:carboxypeptidase regulatory-like domain-containing protein [Gemmatimonadota bacterium]